jgi:hypothetical protein
LSEQKQVILPFVRDGLQAGECCLFIAGERTLDDWELEFQAFGIDVAGQRQAGALVISAGEEMRRSSDFNSILKASDLWAFIESKLSSFAGVRIVGDADWALIDPPLSASDLCQWEATADLLYENEPVRTICMYDLNQHRPAEIRAALRTHSKVLFAGKRYVNNHYEAPEILENEPHWNDSEADWNLIEQMLGQLNA